MAEGSCVCYLSGATCKMGTVCSPPSTRPKADQQWNKENHQENPAPKVFVMEKLFYGGGGGKGGN